MSIYLEAGAWISKLIINPGNLLITITFGLACAILALQIAILFRK
jgi:hypothetical protein